MTRISSRSSIAYSSRLRLSRPGDLPSLIVGALCLTLVIHSTFLKAGPQGLAVLTFLLIVWRRLSGSDNSRRATDMIVADAESIRRVKDNKSFVLLRGSFCSAMMARLIVAGNQRPETLWLFSAGQNRDEWRRFQVLWAFRHRIASG